MTVYDLLTDLRRQGFTLRPAPGGLLGIQPKNKLTDALRETIKRHKTEILAMLARPASLSFDDVHEVFPGAHDLTPAVAWLWEQLITGPQHIAVLISEWIVIGNCQGDRKHEALMVDDLMTARWTLGVVAYEGEDGRLWWRLPQPTVQ